MPELSPSDLKKRLFELGFEVYRTLGPRVVLADRVRDNLIMDSGVSVESVGEEFVIRTVFRAQTTEFPGESAAQLVARARAAADDACSAGYVEEAVHETPVKDPGDPNRTIDTWHEVTLSRGVSQAELHGVLTEALRYPKVAVR